jgi:hypothetical protein
MLPPRFAETPSSRSSWPKARPLLARHPIPVADLLGQIRFDNDRQAQDALIGPMASLVGEAGRAHELGEEFRGHEYPERPFMAPALEKNLDRFAGDWAGSIGE